MAIFILFILFSYVLTPEYVSFLQNLYQVGIKYIKMESRREWMINRFDNYARKDRKVNDNKYSSAIDYAGEKEIFIKE
jgi:hypothetical protein